MLKNIENIIFDLGEVIIDLNFKLTENAFTKLLNIPSTQLYSYQEQSSLFDKLETGKISPNIFRNELRRLAENNSLSDTDIDAAWNAMLLHIEPEKIDLVKELRKTHTTFVLSNTNEIHIDFVNQKLLPSHNLVSLKEIFDFVYYSHTIGERKPDTAAFQFILDKHNVEPSKTLFIDDKLENIETAQKLNFKTWHLLQRDDLYQLLV